MRTHTPHKHTFRYLYANFGMENSYGLDRAPVFTIQCSYTAFVAFYSMLTIEIQFSFLISPRKWFRLLGVAMAVAVDVDMVR